MMQTSRYTCSRMGLDNRVWLTLLLTMILSLGLFGFRLATTKPCYEVRLHLKGVVQHQHANEYYAGESIIFTADMKQAGPVEWDFGDGTPVAAGRQVTHSFLSEGRFLITAMVNGRCMQSVNVRISPVALPVAVPVPSAPAGLIIGKDFAASGELAIYQTEAAAGAYEWTIENNAAFPPRNGNKVSYSFTEPGTYVLKLKLDNDEARIYRKTITVSMNPVDAKGVTPDELPPLPLPAPPAEGGAATEDGSAAKAVAPAPEEKRIELIPDPILKNQLQDVVDGKETLESMAPYLCPGAKIKGNGKIYANLSLFGEELKGKKVLGLWGKRKIRSVHANREPGSNCIFRLDVEYK